MYSHFGLGVDHRSVTESFALLRKSLVLVCENLTVFSENPIVLLESLAFELQ